MVQYALVVALALVSAWPSTLAARAGEKGQSMGTVITIRVGDKVFAATLEDNTTAMAFKTLLPLSITMTELNGNEKFATLSGTVAAHASVPVSIRTGDLMLYHSNTLVLFYKSFSTTYSYTKIGKVDDPAGLEAALGSADVAVTFEATRQKE